MPRSGVSAAAFFGVALGVAGAPPSGPAAYPSLPRGQVVERIACRADPTKSYALYLPSGHDASRPWPVVFALDPGARGWVPVERFREAAETWGYVVAGSNDSRNGPMEPSARAVLAMIEDARARLWLDERRVYLAGFSGGARAASILASLGAVKVAGLVACGAGLGQGLDPASVRPAYYLGIVGALDFNYLEMRELDRHLREKGVAHRLILTDERHAWPPADVCTRALAWLELVAMTTGLRPRDEALIASVLDAEEGAAAALERKGDLEWAAVAYEEAAPVARALRPASPIPGRLEALRGSEELRRQEKKEDERARTEKETLARFGRALVLLRDAPTSEVPLDRVLDELGLNRLVEAGRAASDSKDGQMAMRLLSSLTAEARSLGRAALDAGDGPGGGLFFHPAMRGERARPALPERPARVAGLRQEPGRGLQGRPEAPPTSRRGRLRRPRVPPGAARARRPAGAARVPGDSALAACRPVISRCGTVALRGRQPRLPLREIWPKARHWG